jgi:hypothetical protein
MLQPLQIHDPSSWLIHASYYNRLWHQCDDFLRTDPLPELSDTEDSYYKSRRSMLLNQKLNCQLTALRMAYSQVQKKETLEHDLVLVIDPDEKGIKGDGIFYSLYAQHSLTTNSLTTTKCHIPYSALLENLTEKEQLFFNIQPSI